MVETAIHSKYRNAFLGYVILGVMFLFNICLLLLNWGPHVHLGVSLGQIGVLLFFGAFLYFWQRANRILIDREKRTIQFRRFFSQEICVYAMSELDGYYTTIERNKNGKAKVLHLVKNRRRIKKLSGFTYSNIDEMEAAIGQMTARVMR